MLVSRQFFPITKQNLLLHSPRSLLPIANTRTNRARPTSSQTQTTPLKSFHFHQETPPPKLPSEAISGFINGQNKTIELAHSVWQQLVQKQDTVIDATCGNGHDTLALAKMVFPQAGGCVYALDIQKCAVESTASLLKANAVNETVKLFQLCHTRMEELIPEGAYVRVVAFNLGYLPGGDKSVTTVSDKTLGALEAASRLVGSGGVISVMVYVGHSGGREEYEIVLSFAAGLSAESWVCSKFEMVNRQLAPVLVLMFKK